MKILQINALFGDKSTGRIVKDIHDNLKNKGYQAFVAYKGRTKQTENEIIIGSGFDWKMHAIYTRLTGMQGLASINATKDFLKQLDDIKPDIIHLHNIHSNFLNYKLLLDYTAKYQIPIVMTLHDCWFFTGKCYHFLDIGCEKWKSECRMCPKKKMDIPTILKDKSSKVFRLRKQLYDINNLFVVGCSQWITNCANESPLFKKATVIQIYNGIDINIFTPNAENLKCELKLGECFVIITMANKWFDLKNKNARTEILKSLGENDRVLVVGCKKEQIKTNKEKQVVTIGYIKDQHYLARLYVTGDVFLNLTFVDTLPTVNMEAASCGTPVITYDSGGSGELVQEGVTGYIIEKQNIKELLDAISKVKKGLIDRENCRIWAANKFDRNKNYQQYLNLYNKIYISQRKGELQ